VIKLGLQISNFNFQDLDLKRCDIVTMNPSFAAAADRVQGDRKSGSNFRSDEKTSSNNRGIEE
jgi:hypothetical protein